MTKDGARKRCSQNRRLAGMAFALAGALLLAGCGGGGGGGGVRPGHNNPPPPPPPDPCDTNPQSDPSCPGYIPPYANGQDNLLRATGADKAHDAGYTGQGVKVAIMDSGIDTTRDTLKGLDFHFDSWTKQYTGEGGDDPNDITGHGSYVAETLVGRKTDQFAGGIAPDVDLYIGQTCASDGCMFNLGVPDFFNQGVRLFNLSAGYGPVSYPGGDVPVDSRLKQNFEPLVNGGALFVWPTGNEGSEDISWLATAPARNPALKDGWLAAAGVQLNNDGNVIGLWNGGGHGASSNCGIAKDWCVSAPYHIWLQGGDAYGYAYGDAYGTSFSTPIVTGVAALTWGAYPWMSNRNVQQTVLTTATHLSNDPSKPTSEYIDGKAYKPNETYGWGMINADRAVHGPGQFVGRFDANVGNYNSVFSNAVSGSGSLLLNGTKNGSLELSADNTYTGGTTIQSGTLLLSGSVASDVTVGKNCTTTFGCATSNATLKGDGTVHGDVFNLTGNVWSANFVKDQGLTIGGNYTAGNTSRTSVALGHTLTVGGTANLDGTLALTPEESTYTVKATEKLIVAGKRVGTFDSTDASGVPLYNVTVKYDGNDVLADVARANTSSAMAGNFGAITTAAEGIENALGYADEWSQNNYGAHREFLTSAARFLSASSMDNAKASVQSISGELHGTVRAVEAQSSNQLDHAVAIHQFATVGTNGPSLWMQGYANNGGLSQNGYASTRSKGNGVMAGASTTVGSARIGGFVGRSDGTSHIDGLGGTIDSRDSSFGAYGTLDFGNMGYLAGRASWTSTKLDVKRSLLLGNTITPTTTRRDDHVVRATVEYGKSFGRITPYVSLTGLQLKQGGFAETGGEGFGLTAKTSRHTATLASAGIRSTGDFKWAAGHSWITGYFGATSVLSGRDTGFNGALQGAAEADFRVPGQNLPATLWRAGLMVNTQINRNWSWYMDLSAQAASGRYHSLEANAGVRYSF